MLKRIITPLLMVLAFAISAQAADLKMDCNAIYGATNFHSQGAKLFADKVAEYTSGSVQITVHPGGSLGFKGPELLKTVKDGTLPMSDILMGVVSGSDQVFGGLAVLVVVAFPMHIDVQRLVKPRFKRAHDPIRGLSLRFRTYEIVGSFLQIRCGGTACCSTQLQGQLRATNGHFQSLVHLIGKRRMKRLTAIP